MNSRERMRRAILFQGPDRVPHSFKDVFPLFQVEPASWQPEEPYYPYVHPMIVKYGVWKSRRPLPKGWLKLTREAIDEWGTVWRVSEVASLGTVLKGALEDGWHLLDGYKPPDFSDWSRYVFMNRLGKALGRLRFKFAVDTNSIWERFHFLRGFNNAVADIIEHPSETRRLLEMLTDAVVVRAEMFHRAGAEAFMLLDDWGTQERSFISPVHFEEFFEPCYRRIADKCHELGMIVGIHSCGGRSPKR